MENKKDNSKESIQQHAGKSSIKGIRTPEPPQKKDPAKTAVADEDLKKGKQKGPADKG